MADEAQLNANSTNGAVAGLTEIPGAIIDGVGALVKAPVSIAVGVLTAGPRAIAAIDTMFKDVAAMSESVRTLPAVVDELSAIHDRVNNLDDEVMQMRSSVGGIDDQIDKIAKIGDSLEELTDVLHPLRTANARLHRIRGRRDPSAGADDPADHV